MTTITSEFTKEQLIEKLKRKVAVAESYPDVEEAKFDVEVFRIALASLDDEIKLRPVGVMSESAFHRLERSESRFIALWPRPGIFLPRPRPDDGVIVYAKVEGA
ncbi:hypothetical protein R1917_10235 [Citrobacter koseri]|uniref:hypothetical protein n=1 Tax=Citrobacter koseri TaxID=545 RepID=UPI0029431187|nr:hypothetical protein [Citrobacter koseri]WOJ32680.1 hypothetical protein R1917_10235 [Citrobacter koseri]WOJ36853.1 hypothetical protein R1243_07780 [Citrobacter koseri]